MVKFLALASSIFVFAFIAIFSPLFEIKEVNFIDDQKCVSNFKEYSETNLKGENIIFLQPQEVISQLQENYPCIEKIGIDRKYPSGLSIDIQARSPIVKINDTDYQITKDGLIVHSNDRVGVPTIFLPQGASVNLGQKIDDPLIIKTLEIIANLLKSDFIPASIRIISDEEIAVYNSKDILVVFTSKISAQDQVDSLQLILGKAKIDAEKIEKIDLRFDKVVITNK